MRSIMIAPHDIGRGEALERTRKRRMRLFIGVLFGAGMIVGFLSSQFERDYDSGLLSGTLPPGFALFAAAAMLLATLGGAYVFYRRTDELERHDNLYSAAIGGNALMIGYPAWFLLWKGGWLPEPSHGALFAIVFATSVLAYGWAKLRHR